MRKLIIMACVGLTAYACWAKPKSQTLDLALGSLTAKTGTLSQVSGYLEDINVTVSDLNSTGSVKIAYVPQAGSAVNIATNLVAGQKVFRPVVDSTDILGAALTSDPPRRMYLYGETLRVIVAGSPTNKTWTIRIKTTDE